MRKYDPTDLLISLHIPKCGGQSFRNVLRTWFGYGFHLHIADHTKNIAPAKPKLKLLIRPLLPLVIHGHFDEQNDGVGVFNYYPEAKQFITILRDPVERQISQYFYTKMKIRDKKFMWNGKLITDPNIRGKDVDETLEMTNESFLRFFPWEFTFENYKSLIDKYFVHVGITENLQTSMDIIADKLNKKRIQVPLINTAPKTETPSESSIQKFRENHLLDCMVYEYARQLNPLTT